MKKIISFIAARQLTLLMVIMLIIGGCVTEKDEPEWYLRAGDALPYFEVVTLDGERVSSEDSYTATMVIVFFNTTCKDCQRKLPVLQKQYEENLQLPASEQYLYLCISREEGAEDVERYWKDNHLTLPVAAQDDRILYSQFASIGIPRIFYAKDGIIIRSE